jgi:hypothetical protein
MMRNVVVVLLLGGAAVLSVPLSSARPAADKPPGKKEAPPAPAPGAPLITLAASASARPGGALQYRLLPGPLERKPGNAAQLWGLAALAARAGRGIADEEYRWADASAVPLKKLPLADVKRFLARYAGALRRAREAARREYCDWGLPPLTFQSLPDQLPLDSIQSYREVALLLSVQCRLEMAEGHFDQALDTLQTGMTLARHLGDSDLLLQDLVAIAIAHVMLSRVEEWVQIPNSPNLYWPLTALPRPFLDVRRSMEYELNTVYRSYPQLQTLRKKTLSAREVDDVVEQLIKLLSESAGGQGPKNLPWAEKIGAAVLAAKLYPDARKRLLARGRTAREIEAMPMMQAVVIDLMDEHDRLRDDIVKWLGLPPWQAGPGLERVEKEVKAAGKAGNVIVGLLMPAFLKVYGARVRLDRHVAGLRGAEALRLYAAAHGGKAPAKWADLTDVPLPVDPVTGKGFDAFYQVKDGVAILEVPAPPGQGALVGRRYEMPAGR